MKTTNNNSKTTNFTRKTIAPGIEQLNPKTYRARASYQGVRYEFRTTNRRIAKAWINQVKTTGKTGTPTVK